MSFHLAHLVPQIILSRVFVPAPVCFVCSAAEKCLSEKWWWLCVCGKVKVWQVERPHPRLFGTVPLSHCAHGTSLPLEAFQERASTLGTGGLPTPRAHLPLTSLFSTLPHFGGVFICRFYYASAPATTVAGDIVLSGRLSACPVLMNATFLERLGELPQIWHKCSFRAQGWTFLDFSDQRSRSHGSCILQYFKC